VQKFEILFKFAYIGWYLTENTGIAWYLVVQTGTGRYLTGTISNINVYLFFIGTVDISRYDTVFITMEDMSAVRWMKGCPEQKE